MPLMDLTTPVVVAANEIASDKRVSGAPRRTEWIANLEYIAGLFLDGETEWGEDAFLQLATFNSASGARAKMVELEGRVLPFQDLGQWRFRYATWIKEDGQGRGSTLFCRFDVASV